MMKIWLLMVVDVSNELFVNLEIPDILQCHQK